MANTAARLRGYHHQHRTSAHNKAMHALGSRQIGKTACGGCPMGGRVPLSTLVYWFAAHDTYVKCPINFPISQVGTLPRLIERDCESPTGCLGCAPDHLQLHNIEGRRRAALLPQMFQQKFLTSSFLWIKKETWFICFWEGALEAETTHLHQHPSLLHCIPFYLSPTLFSSLLFTPLVLLSFITWYKQLQLQLFTHLFPQFFHFQLRQHVAVFIWRQAWRDTSNLRRDNAGS